MNQIICDMPYSYRCIGLISTIITIHVSTTRISNVYADLGNLIQQFNTFIMCVSILREHLQERILAKQIVSTIVLRFIDMLVFNETQFE